MATAQKPAEDQQDDQNKVPAKTATKKLIVTKTFRTQGKDKKRVEFIASPEPQDLGEHAAMALKAGVAIEPTKASE
ncbi:hypothetical protein [Marinomonas ostreistagni]|uniref:Uncharacterized protein n=1 Tax=Marinomonas ostreistagni TaxID=359209 RepID=A0ABS0ZAT3_9GAMM|nr:hypothetical protein [Marinomonas ostreistagni]MBJ7550747.1 hypothetical protein [Marinomonas ostreistagni]